MTYVRKIKVKYILHLNVLFKTIYVHILEHNTLKYLKKSIYDVSHKFSST